jgi:hypothetical protein
LKSSEKVSTALSFQCVVYLVDDLLPVYVSPIDVDSNGVAELIESTPAALRDASLPSKLSTACLHIWGKLDLVCGLCCLIASA